MKGKFRSIGRVVFVLMLVLSLSLVAAPVSAADGSGTCTVSPTWAIKDLSTTTLTFTFTAAETMDEGAITITMADGWTAPQVTSGSAGYTTATTTGAIGTLGFASQIVTVPITSLASGQTITVVYGDGGGASGATADADATATFTTKSNLTGGTPAEITTSPTVEVVTLMEVVDGEDTILATIVDGTSFYIHVTSTHDNLHPAAPDTLDVPLNIYDGVAQGATSDPISTATYTATETGATTTEFWTDAISTADLGVRPGYKLESGVATAFILAEISFDKSYYDINETMTITLQDDIWNLDATAIDTPTNIGTCEVDGSDIAAGAGPWTETGEDTGVFTWSGTPSDMEFDAGQSMPLIYSHADTTDDTEITATAWVLMSSTSSVVFDKGTYDVDAASATVTVTDADKNTSDIPDTISGADVLVVENLTTGDSVSFSSLTETAAENGEFTGTVDFGTGTGEIAINDGDTLQATYTDPATPADVSTVTAAVGYTVFLYEADGTLHDSYTTIEEAIDDAEATWTVKVSEAYNSTDEALPITISVDGLTVESVAGAATTIIDCEGTSNGIEITAADVTVDGFTVLDSNSPAVLITGAAVTDVTVEGCTIKSSATLAVHGIAVEGGATGATISGNVIENVTGSGGSQIALSNVSDCEVSDNTLTDSYIWLAGVSTGTISGNNVSGVDSAGCITIGTSSTNILIEDNSLSNGAAGIVAFDNADVGGLQILGNDITNNTLSNGEGIAIGSGVTWGNDNAIKFNNITGNTVGIANYMNTDVDATHNWWGAATGPAAGTISDDVTVDPWLGASIVPGAAAFTYNTDSLDAETAVGVKVSGVEGNNAKIGAAVYTANPKAEFTAVENGFLDVYVVPADTIDAADEIIVKFYAGDEDSVVYAWNELYGTWEACTLQGFSPYGGYIWVKVHSELADVVTVPTIEALEGLPFAISGIILESIAASPESVTLVVDGTQPLTVTATYSDSSTPDVTAESTYESNDTSVATVSTGGLITAIVEGDATVTVTYLTKTAEVSVTVSEEGIKGDFDGNNEVDFDDFVSFGDCYGSESGDANYNAIGDFDDSGVIDFDDFVAFGDVYGTSW